VFTATTDLIVSSAPPERAGAASGISETGAELGGAFGIAILGSIGVAVYRGQLADTLPEGVPDQAVAVARETLGGAVAVAAQLPGQVGTAVLEAAQAAFLQGMRLTVTLSAVVAAGIAVLATVLLRSVPTTAQAEREQQPVPAPEPAAEPVPAARFEEAFQVIRSGSGCVACPPAERRQPDVQRT
jgi:MFS transporter, DHA2 family, multidrug resistance protein